MRILSNARFADIEKEEPTVGVASNVAAT